MAGEGKVDALVIEYNPAAFKHGVSRESIRYVICHAEYDAPMEGFINKYIAIGFDTHANLLEVMYNPIDEHTINVFHAMPCREMFCAYLPYLGEPSGEND